MRLFWFVLVALLVGCVPKEASKNAMIKMAVPQLIPKPQSMELSGQVAYVLSEELTVFDEGGFESETEMLSAFFDRPIRKVESPEEADIRFQRSRWSRIPEAYLLNIDSSGVQITAGSNHGAFNAVMTLVQWKKGDHLKHVTIDDEPSFRHRGMLLDCCRHFMEPEFVKRYIDLLARYKMNVLHWHLTEDQGWRVEIDAYPKLTEVGAWRTEKDSSIHGGFYTKEEMRDIVAYAAARHIKVIPEIELPGHSSAAIASYPWLSCTGEQIPVENEWGVFKDIYCAGNDSTIAFLETVLDEVLEIFPSDVIHIGGDEAPKTRWEQCEKCQRRIKEEGLHDEHELQSWMIGHFAEFLDSRGRKLIGWDEILEGGLPEGAMVQSWRGMEGGITAAEMEREVVMSPTSHAYFDYDVRSTDLEEVYSFDPIPESLSADQAKYIIGGECNMWTEHAPQDKVDSKVFPRILAMAEVLWAYPEERNYQEFERRVDREYAALDELGVDYGAATVPFEFASAEPGKVSIVDRVSGLKVSWRTFGEAWQEGREIKIPPGLHEYEVVGYKNGRVYGDTIELNLANHLALGAPTKVINGFSDWYTGGGDKAMTDGFSGSFDFRDGHWQAEQGVDMIYEIDLGESTSISSVQIPVYIYGNAWIFSPEYIDLWSSDDGLNWEKFARIDMPSMSGNVEQRIVVAGKNWDEFTTRYVKVEAKNPGPCPEWHDAAGQPSWVFMSEIVIN
ncbi:glycoside hydrolase family 20 protein [Sanyastnella coralliicola]|uniref:glycoside hydrolase family 20 protein n=1 Tax=Sanyastnella coralliicola TaxID=3069118 RepID=UPI0027B899BC|nr:family 20 glycosylhydrolase [Longitalea sp. SCSIO 12813]